MTFPRRLAAIPAALLVAATASVVAAASSGGAADVSATAFRVEPPPAVRGISPDQRAELEVAGLVNQVRVDAGMAPLAWNDQVASAAHTHATYMASTGVPAHEGPPGITASERLDAVGFAWTTWGETIGGGYTEPRAVVDAWALNPTTRQTLLDPLFEYVGAGAVASADGTPFWSLLLVATTEIPIP